MISTNSTPVTDLNSYEAIPCSTEPKGEAASISSISWEKVKEIATSLFPLTSPYTDKDGYTIQLWTCHSYPLFASVQKQTKLLQILNGSQIYNALQPAESNHQLLNRLKTIGIKQWQLAYIEKNQEIVVWPLLTAAGKGDASSGPNQPPKNFASNITKDWKVGKQIQEHAYDKHVVEQKEFKGLIKSKGQFREVARWLLRHHTSYKHSNGGRTAYWHKATGLFTVRNSRVPGSSTAFKPTSGKDYYDKKVFGESKSNPKAVEKNLKEILKSYPWIKSFPKGSGSSPDGKGGGGPGGGFVKFIIATFRERLQQNKLTDSYNSSNSSNKMPAHNSSGGSIGGVGHDVGIINGLFDSYQSSLEYEHLFYMPSADGKMPFTNGELQQILRELTIGLYVHDTVPFFSLHFNADTNMYPVIHPAYENTLVGHVISMLDYYMKGFLNGGFFKEQFVLDWQSSKTHDPAFLKTHLTDIHEYCVEHLGPDVHYQSVREMIDQFIAQESQESQESNRSSSQEPSLFADYSGFRSSFRIIAKQNSIKKTENLFLLDGDFDVFYTIEPDATYKAELQRFRQLYGRDPLGYQRLEKAYKRMSRQIKELMPRLPIFRELFEMLKLINFVCYYLKTLKKENKIPLLETKGIVSAKGCPPLFPHLPIRKVGKKKVTLNFSKAFQRLSQQDQTELQNLLLDARNNPSLPARFQEALIKNLIASLEEQTEYSLAPYYRKHSFYIPLIEKSWESGLNSAKKQLDELDDLLIRGEANQKIWQEQLTEKQKLLAEKKEALKRKKLESHQHAETLEKIKKERASVESLQGFFNAKTCQEFLSKLDEGLLNTQNLWEASQKELILILGELDSLNKDIAKLEIKLEQLKWLSKESLTLTERNITILKNQLSDQAVFSTWYCTQLSADQAIKNLNGFFAESFLNRTVKTVSQVNGIIPFHKITTARGELSVRSEKTKMALIEQEELLKYIQDYPNTVKQEKEALIKELLHRFLPKEFDVNTVSLQLLTEQDREEAVQNRKIVGGCGIDLSNQPVTVEISGEHILDKHYSRLLHEQEETLQKVAGGGGPKAYQGFCFKLSCIDYYALNSGDYSWMQELLVGDRGGLNSETQEVFNALANSDEKGVLEASQKPEINWHATNASGMTLAHLAALSSDPYKFLELIVRYRVDFSKKDSSGHTPLHLAAQKGDLNGVRFLVGQARVTLDQATSDGATPFYYAVQGGHLEVAKFLMEQGVNINVVTNHGMTPLYSAIYHGYVEISCHLLVHGNNIDCQRAMEDGNTPLLLATEMGLFEVVDALLRKGAKVDCQRLDGFTPLHLAAKNGYMRICDLLLQQENVAVNSQLRSGHTPLYLAIHSYNNLIVSMLLSKGADPWIRGWDEETALMAALLVANHGAAQLILSESLRLEEIGVFGPNGQRMVEFPDALGRKPLQVAVDLKQPSVVTSLIDAKVTLPHTKNELFLWVCRHVIDLEIVKRFIERERISEDSYLMSQGFLEAAKSSNNMLMHHFALVYRTATTYKDEQGRSVIHYAAKDDQFNFIEELVKSASADLVQLDKRGHSLAAIAAYHGSIQSLKILVEEMERRGIALDHQYEGKHLLWAALEGGHIKAVDTIYQGVLSINFLDSHKTNPLHLVARYGDKRMVEFLKLRGESFVQVDAKGYTAWHYAIENKWMDCIDYMLHYKNEIPCPKDLLHFVSGIDDSEPILRKLVEQKGLSVESGIGNNLETPIFNAIRHDCWGNFNFLIEKGASLGVKTIEGLTPLLFAAKLGKAEFIDQILMLNNSCRDDHLNGQNALHLAASFGHEMCVTYLLQKGFELARKDGKGETALVLAQKKGYSDIVPILEGKSEEWTRRKHSIVSALEQFDEATFFRLIEGLPLNRAMDFEYQKQNLACPLGHLICLITAGNLAENAILKRFLSKQGIDLLSRDNNGRTLLHLLAIKNEYVDIPQPLHKVKDDLGITPWHYYAAYATDRVLVKMIESAKERDLNVEDKKGNTPLYLAIEEGKVENVQLLLRYGANVNHRNSIGLTPLLSALQLKKMAIVETLLKMGANVDCSIPYNGITPAHIAVSIGSIDAIRLLYSCGASLETPDHAGIRPIHYAVEKGHVEVVQFLKSIGVSINVYDQQGLSIGHYAARADSFKVIDVLQNMGIPVDLPKKSVDSHSKPKFGQRLSGYNSLHIAAKLGDVDLYEKLLKLGVSDKALDEKQKSVVTYAAMSGKKEMLEKVLSRSSQPDFKEKVNAMHHTLLHDNPEALALLAGDKELLITMLDDIGSTALHYAATYGAVKCLEYMFSLGIDLSVRSLKGNTALEFAVKRGHHSAARYLLENGEFDLNWRDQKGLTCLHIACEGGDRHMAALLVEYGADPNAVDYQSLAPLHYAARAGNKALIQLLLTCGADMFQKTTFNRSISEELPQQARYLEELFHSYEELNKIVYNKKEGPIHRAIRCKDNYGLTVLLQREDVDAVNINGATPLHLAVHRANLKQIRLLLQYEANLEIKDGKGRTPLFIAATKLKDPSLVQFLTHAKANVAVEDNNGQTLLDAIVYSDYYPTKRAVFDIVKGALPEVDTQASEWQLIRAAALSAIKQNYLKEFFTQINRGYRPAEDGDLLLPLAFEHKSEEAIKVLTQWFPMEVCGYEALRRSLHIALQQKNISYLLLLWQQLAAKQLRTEQHTECHFKLVKAIEQGSLEGIIAAIAEGYSFLSHGDKGKQYLDLAERLQKKPLVPVLNLLIRAASC